MNRPKGHSGLGDKPVGGARLREVAGNCECRTNFGTHLFGPIGVPSVDDDARTFGDELARRLEPDARSRASDETNPILEAEVHRLGSLIAVTTLLLVRHGETDWNRDGRWQGGSDTRLNDLGREQARALAEELDGSIDVVYSSDLARARETADIVATTLGLEVRVDPRLRERSFGSWEGLTTTEIEERFADSHRRWREGEGAGADDAETFEDFFARVSAFLADVLRLHPREEVLVISHGGSIRVIHALAAGVDYVRDHRLIPGVANCSVARYAARDGKLAPLD